MPPPLIFDCWWYVAAWDGNHYSGARQLVGSLLKPFPTRLFALAPLTKHAVTYRMRKNAAHDQGRAITPYANVFAPTIIF